MESEGSSAISLVSFWIFKKVVLSFEMVLSMVDSNYLILLSFLISYNFISGTMVNVPRAWPEASSSDAYAFFHPTIAGYSLAQQKESSTDVKRDEQLNEYVCY